MKFRSLLLRSCLLPVLCAASLSNAQTPGVQDPAFAAGPESAGFVATILLESNGQVLVGGSFTAFRGAGRTAMARLNADGSLDSFDPGAGLVSPDGTTPPGVAAIALQPDGRIVVAGLFSVVNQAPLGGVVRLNADGSVDPTFNVGGGVQSSLGANMAQAVTVLSTGQILVGGTFQSFDGVAATGLVRLNANGSVDTAFNAGGAGFTQFNTNPYVTTILPLANGQVLVGGNFDAYNGVESSGVVRLNADGSMDPNFSAGIGAGQGTVNTLSLQADGKVLAAGIFSFFDAVETDSRVVRLNTDGSMDPSFSSATPNFFIADVFGMLVQPDGKVVISGQFAAAGPGGLLRLNADGSLDTSFSASNGVKVGMTLALQPDGNLLAAYNDQPSTLEGSDAGDVLRVYDAVSTGPTPTPVPMPPTVTIVPGVGKTLEDGSGGPATFVVTISAAPSTKTTIKYSIKGSARAGVDYEALTGKAKIKPGKTSATVSVYPIEQHITGGGVTTVKATLLPGSGYTVGNMRTAKAKIVDND